MTSTLDTNHTTDTLRDVSGLTAAHTGFTVSTEDFINDWRGAKERSNGMQNQHVNDLPALLLVASLEQNGKPCDSRSDSSTINLECLADIRRQSTSEINRFEREQARLKAEQNRVAEEAFNKHIDDTASKTIEKVLQQLPEQLTRGAVNGDKAVGVYAVYENQAVPRTPSYSMRAVIASDTGDTHYWTNSELVESARKIHQPTLNEVMENPDNRVSTDSMLLRLRKPEIELFETLKKRGLKPFFAYSDRIYMAVELP